MPRVPSIGECICVDDDVPGRGRKIINVEYRLHDLPWIHLEEIGLDADEEEVNDLITYWLDELAWEIEWDSLAGLPK